MTEPDHAATEAESGRWLHPVPDPNPPAPSPVEPASAPDQARERPPQSRAEDADTQVRRLRLTKASQIRIRPTFWVWDGRIPSGAITIGPGREGIGKSLFCCWLAAQITRGTLPGVHHGHPRGVIYAATEDSWEATIAPRLVAAGADVDRVYRVEVDHASGVSLPLTLPRDCAELAIEITGADVALLVLDPLISAVDSRVNVNQEELRTALEPLAQLADTTGCSVFGLAHFNKASGTDVLSRITGSRAFSAVARAALAFARDPDAEDGSCVMSQAKNNLGSLDLPSLRYLVEPITIDTDEGPGNWGCLRFIGETDKTVEQILNDTGNADESTERADATAWLEDYLTQQGKTRSADAKKAGKAAGFAERTLTRACKSLKVVTEAEGFPRQTYWSLP